MMEREGLKTSRYSVLKALKTQNLLLRANWRKELRDRAKIREEYMHNPDKYKQIVWDYILDSKTFFELLDGKVQKSWFDRNWATARDLENVNYYDAVNLVDIDYLKLNWSNIKRRIYNKAIKNGYDYILRKRALSITG